MNDLKELGFKDLGYLMHAGIYVLLLDGKVVYVGQTTNLFKRIADHMQDGRAFDKIYFVKCDITELDRVEALMIHKLKPDQGSAWNFNTDPAHAPANYGPGQTTHTITVGGKRLELKGRRRV